MRISNSFEDIYTEALELCKEQFCKIEKVAEHNQQRMLVSFIKNKVGESHINSTSTGYGYSDLGRDCLERVYADYFETEDALVRHSFVSGTHALTVALFGLLRPGDTLLSITGPVYDTLKGVVGLTFSEKTSGSLTDFHIGYDQLDLTDDGLIDLKNLKNKIKENTKVVYIQKSKGYSLRPAVPCSKISEIVDVVKKLNKEIYIVVDNCYGEFTETTEPTAVGADLAVGSLIKNPGGGIARSGGYIVGKKKLVDMCAQRLKVPGFEKEIGASLNLNRELFLGFFNAPSVVEQALKTSVFASALFTLMGYDVFPKYDSYRADIVTAILLRNSNNLAKFCQTIQRWSPVDSFIRLEPWPMPGYSDKIIMASGSFTSGSSIELSADAPLREPYAVYLQGSLNFHSGKLAVCKAAEEILKNKM